LAKGKGGKNDSLNEEKGKRWPPPERGNEGKSWSTPFRKERAIDGLTKKKIDRPSLL